MSLIQLLVAAEAAGVYDENSNNADVVNLAEMCSAHPVEVEYTKTAARPS
jgi:hypothetical protein